MNVKFNFNPSANDRNIATMCETILNTSKFKEIYFLKADNESHENDIILLQKSYPVVIKTFSNLTKKNEERTANCKNGITEAPYSIVVFLLPTKVTLINLFYDHSSLPNTIFILVMKKITANVKFIIRKSWKKKYIHKVVIASKNDETGYIFDPLYKCEKGGSFRKLRISSRTEIISYLNRKLKSLKGCLFRITMYPREQTAVLLENKTFTGQDGKLIDLLAEKMHFKPVINVLKGKMTYGYKTENSTYVGTFANLIDGTSDISLNGHFMKDYNCNIVELTRQITSDRVCLLTPKAGIIPPIITVLKSFQPEVWAMIIVTYIIVVTSFYCWNNFSLRYMKNEQRGGCILALEIFRIMIASPLTRKSQKYSEKILFVFCWFFSVVILNAFQGSLVTFLNTPMHFPDINTFDELIDSGLPLRSSSYTFRELLLSDPTLSKLEKKLYFSKNVSAVENFQGRFAGFQRINVYNLKYFNDIRYVLNEKESRLLHTMKQCISSYFISYAIPKNSPYKSRIDEIISRVEQAGLLIKWNDDSAKYILEKYELITKEKKSTKVFSLTDLEVAFFVLICGLITSTFVLVIEIITGKRHFFNNRKLHIRMMELKNQF